MKVAHLIPTLHADGPEIGLVDLAGAARQADIELIVIGLSVSSDTAEISALRRAGVPVDELGLAPWDPRAVARDRRKLLREQRAELVHTHLPQADVVGAAAAAAQPDARRVHPAPHRERARRPRRPAQAHRAGSWPGSGS